MTDAPTAAAAPEHDELTRVQELVYELRVQEVMTATPITVTPATPLAELMEIMRVRRISGAPVVHPADGRLLGIISIQDLIQALNAQRAGDRVAS